MAPKQRDPEGRSVSGALRNLRTLKEASGIGGKPNRSVTHPEVDPEMPGSSDEEALDSLNSEDISRSTASGSGLVTGRKPTTQLGGGEETASGSTPTRSRLSRGTWLAIIGTVVTAVGIMVSLTVYFHSDLKGDLREFRSELRTVVRQVVTISSQVERLDEPENAASESP